MSVLQSLKLQLGQHPLYGKVTSMDHLRIFMEHHVFAVWDFMSLAKRLQRDLTSEQVPWIPRPQALYTRLINEIMLDEESDDDGRGGYASHFELYLAAMSEAGADTTPVRRFVQALQQGQEPGPALERLEVPVAVREFVLHTLHIALNAPLQQVAAAFFYGREDLIPGLFSALLQQWQVEGRPVGCFTYYLSRHIEVDSERHGPMVRRLLDDLCAERPAFQQEAEAVAREVMEHRLRLWNAIDAAFDRLEV